MTLEYPYGMNVWLKVLLDPGERPPRHVHRCPECYEHVPCSDPRCALEPDLDEDDGTPGGLYDVCDGCRCVPRLAIPDAQKAEAATGSDRFVTPSTRGGRAWESMQVQLFEVKPWVAGSNNDPG